MSLETGNQAEPEDMKPNVTDGKSSMEILSELFSSFDAVPPVIIKKEKDETKKHKKSKKKHRHKEKKHKKKSKKSKRSTSVSSESSAVDLSDILIKQENGEGKTFFSDAIEKYIGDEVVKKENEEVILIKDEHEKKKCKKRKRCKHDADEHDSEKRKCKSKSKNKDEDEQERDLTPEKRHRKLLDLRDKLDKHDYKYKDDYKHKDDYKSRDDYRYRDDYKYDDYKSRYRDRDDFYRVKDYDDRRYNKYRENPFYRHRSEEKYQDSEDRIDKKKLLEIARKNAIQMMKSGSLPGALTLGPQAQEKVIAAIKSGGKTVEELTDFCKTLSRKEELGELSSISEDGSDSDDDKPFHHPFQIKDKPLTINIKNSVPIPIKTNQERASELRIQFPVSSGQQHRKTESEWIPVTPKKPELPVAKQIPVTPVTPAVVPPPTPAPQLPPQPPPVALMPPPAAPIKIITPVPVPPVIPLVVPAPVNAPPGPQVFPVQNVDATKENIDIASIVSQRLTAMRKLQENPNDVQAISQMYRVQKEMNTWAESKQQIGQFTGSTGAQILSAAELSSGYQAWARKDQLQTAAPVSGGMGMHLLQKMGWKPGEGLGKEKTGTLEPLLLEVKLDKKGIVAKEEQKKKAVKVQKQTVKTLEGKHPVSLLGEYASKRKLGAPQYVIDFECGPDHKKNFLFKVVLNGIEYKPNVASNNKKEAKALAAKICLQQLGLLPQF